ncbi:MAG: two-component system response regulator [Parvibaculum sp.]|jgi:DNA-binding response OmpR family regulator|uniref:response regulator n=1 Tax=Parvibaculum sp. TaxID=2024848 RepID=UPI000C689624|nr:response regulator [Parvibaculum sp.]MAU61814.1 two-component system response regulator [Parvibaculum sp.]|tara:strand:- start:5474 stop:5995 length:522 start_codon:yes stop_codon:yes gene_type:complete
MSQVAENNRKTLSPEDYAQLGVLIVEDTLYMANMLRGILSGLGVRNIVSARTGEDALSALMRGKVDLAIMDDLEPPLDGLSVVRAIRTTEESNLNEIPVIFVTTRRERASIIEARDAGVTEILSKPFSAQQLIDRIDTVLTRPRAIVRSAVFTGPDRRRRDGKAPLKRRESDR